MLLIHEEMETYNRERLLELIMSCDDRLSHRIVANLLSKYEVNKIMAELYIESRPEAEQDYELTLHHPISDKSIGTIESN